MQTINNIRHRRGGHVSKEEIERMLKNPCNRVIANMHLRELSCKTCVQTKATKQHASRNLVEHSQALLVHTGICGPVRLST